MAGKRIMRLLLEEIETNLTKAGYKTIDFQKIKRHILRAVVTILANRIQPQEPQEAFNEALQIASMTTPVPNFIPGMMANQQVEGHPICKFIRCPGCRWPEDTVPCCQCADGSILGTTVKTSDTP